MKRLIFILILCLVSALSAQQINYSWGQTTAGVAYNQTGVSNVDSISTLTIVYDMQDYYPIDYFPVALGDSSNLYSNSNRLYYGTFWYKLDLQNATDSVKYSIYAYPGHMDYHPNDASRVTVANLDFSSTATVLVDSTADTYTTNDIDWAAVNVYISDAEGKILPPEFIKLFIDFYGTTNDSIAIKWNFAYPALYEREQTYRSTTRTNNLSKKAIESMH